MPKDTLAELSISTSQRDAAAHPEFKSDNQVVMTSKMVAAMPRIQVPAKTDSPSSQSARTAPNEDDDDDDEETPRADMQLTPKAFGAAANGGENDDDDDDDQATPRADADDMKAATTAAASAKTPSLLDQFELLGVLGTGAFAECHLAQRHDDGKLFALKKFKKVMDVLSPQERQEAIGEVRLLANLVHDNILRYEDSFLEGGAMHILMEYASGGTLDRLIDNYKAKGQLLPEELVWDCMVQLCGALKYCHSRSIMHRDIKPQNVMLSTADEKTCKLLLGDFGIAKIMAHQGAQTKELAGTPYYYSPELCKGLAYDNKSDMWAIGVVLFELMAQERPFESNNTFRVLYLISKNERSPTPTTYSKDLQQMCNDLLEVNATDRPSASELLNRDAMKIQVERWRQHVLKMEEAEVASDSRGNNAKSIATTYHKVMERLKYLCRWASNLGAEDANEWYDSMERISARIYKTPELHHVDIYNQLGMVNAEAGNFDEAIKTFRGTLKIDPNDHLAMEQLGNLLVRSAFQMFKEQAEKERAVQRNQSKKSLKTDSSKNLDGAMPRKGSFTTHIQERLDEGIGFLEKVAEMEVSDERLALLGSAYKRLFMLQNGFFPKARAYLKKAAEYYHKADVELKRRKGDGCYAILNALWLDLLLGESTAAALLAEAAPLSNKALDQQAHAPADVWLWVQVADVLCIRYTLNDPEILLDGVTAQYRRALVLGSSDRVKRSIEDQLHFMVKTLEMRREQLALDGKQASEEHGRLAMQLKRLQHVLKFVTEQGKVTRSITKSMTQRRGLAQQHREEEEQNASSSSSKVSSPDPSPKESKNSNSRSPIPPESKTSKIAASPRSLPRKEPQPAGTNDEPHNNRRGSSDDGEGKSGVCVLM